MGRLVLLRAARRDLTALLIHLVRQGADSDVARGFVEALRDQCTTIAGLPRELGLSRPEFGQGVRAFPYRGYVLFPRYDRDALRILRVIEGHRDMPRHVRPGTDPE